LHTAVFSGAQLLVWGGQGASSPALSSGALYDLARNAWRPLSGGVGIFPPDSELRFPRRGGFYDPLADVWTAFGEFASPPGRVGHTAVWTGRRMFVFGGENSTIGLDSGAVWQ